jgi:hypothetical protein
MRKLRAALVAILFVAQTALATTNFPGALDPTAVFGTAVYGQPVLATTVNNIRDAVKALESKVGADASVVTNSLDYLLKNTASVDPGHRHTGASLSAIDAGSITTGTLADARLSANVAFLNATNVFSVLQTFSAGINVTGTVTATTFSGSGASLTNIPETAITDGALLARVGDTETITGSWTFSSPPFAAGTNFSNIPETAILDGALLARVADNELVTGTWSFQGNIAKIRNVPYIWPAANATGALNNDGSGNLSWVAAGAAVTPGGGVGAVQFNTAGAFDGDAATFFWNNGAKRLGIGTNSPAVPLHVVGVIRSTATAGAGSRCVEADSSGNFVATASSCSTATGASGASGAVQFAFSGAFASDATNFFWDDSNNRLGIGTNAPATELDVATGTITSGAHVPTADDIYDLGSPTFRWAELHLGPASLIVHNDATNTDKTTIGYSSGVATWSATAGTPIKVTASAVFSTPALTLAGVTSSTGDGDGILLTPDNTAAGSSGQVWHAVRIQNPPTGPTGTAGETVLLSLDEPTHASTRAYSLWTGGNVGFQRHVMIGTPENSNVAAAKLYIDNQLGFGGSATDRLIDMIPNGAQSADLIHIEDFTGLTTRFVINNFGKAKIGPHSFLDTFTAALSVKGLTNDTTDNVVDFRNSSTVSLLTVRNDGKSTAFGSAAAGTSIFTFTADTTSGTSSTKQFLFQMANTGSPNVNPLRGVYIAEPANSYTGTQYNLYVEDATKASGQKWSAVFAGLTGVGKNFAIGADSGVTSARFNVDNGAASGGAAGTRLFYTVHHASQSGDIWRDETSGGSARFVIAVDNTASSQGAVLGIGAGIDPAADLAQLDVKGSQPASVATNGTTALINGLFVGGKGGNTSGTTGQTGGLGGGWSVTLGDGGDAPGGSTNGDGGSFLFQAGFRGGGAGATGSNGSFGVVAGGGVVNNPIFMRAESNSTTAFEIQPESGIAIFRADTTNEIIKTKEFQPLSNASYALGATGNRWTTAFLSTGVDTPLVTFAGAMSITTTASNGDITMTPDGTGVVHVTSKLTVDGALDPTSLLLSGGAKKIGATDTGTIFLAPFADAVRAVEVRDADATTALVTFDTSNNRVGINKVAPQFSLDVGSTIHADNTISSDTRFLAPEFTYTSALSINTSAGNADITLDPNGTGSVVYSTTSDYSNKAVCYVDASGKLGHCTTSDASSCGCTAN